MTPLVRRYIKTSFVFLLLGAALGGYIASAQFVIGTYPSRILITAHVHLLLVGFMLMVVMGVVSIYAYDARLEEQNLEMVVLINPQEIAPDPVRPAAQPERPRLRPDQRQRNRRERTTGYP